MAPPRATTNGPELAGDLVPEAALFLEVLWESLASDALSLFDSVSEDSDSGDNDVCELVSLSEVVDVVVELLGLDVLVAVVKAVLLRVGFELELLPLLVALHRGMKMPEKPVER
ncbi:hypothetical protein IW146_001414 [Coemansia sp. RSA 922]|nr:hypothetical protein IW146_001414 [Coemansia sp. RSA 922]